MSETSLQFFEDFILRPVAFSDFEEVLKLTESKPSMFTDKINSEGEYEVQYMDFEMYGEPRLISRYHPLDYLFMETVAYNKQMAIRNLFAEIDNSTPAEIGIVAKIKQQYLTYLITAFSEKYNQNQFPEINESLIYIQSEISKRFGLAPITTNISIKPFKKLKWHGQTNILTTLFYELGNEFLDNGEKFINVPQTEIVQFILSCFCDKNGNDFERSTIQTNLNAGKPEKRAKADKRINIENIITKSSKTK